ncbi:murein transglycosylase A [Veronia nyctiphanis]|uniref:Membrane-bound lytic murein transglycosylase A n=1 Tax=Veronia nyctiphanis TaxID=1278244 RepID=A0A4Q0YPR9_9GAMM|nr:murein transglycosylase A [Veronia nyctiphanis]RXJ72535.1 murein transglycosylase A [Veronia nyctiphanis]
MYRLAGVLTASLFLAACARPIDRGQQYLDGSFDEILNPVTLIDSNKPADYSGFLPQLSEVEKLSPSLVKEHQDLYFRVQRWLAESGQASELVNYGIEPQQMGGGDGRGNVLFTGYFSPVIEMRHKPDDTYRYPVYGLPNCGETCPTREEIYQGALDGKGLELGYSESLIDNFIMEVQGSGFVHYGDTDNLEYFAYGGKNGHAYVSIGKVLIERGEVPREKMSLKAIKEWVARHDEATVLELLNHNTSFVFFQPKSAHPVTGTAGVPLLAGASVAADREFLPMGSVLIAEVPQLNEEGDWNGKHQLKLLMALDTGGVVKGNHLDLYHGMGEQAGIDAGHYKYFGRVWKLTTLN